MRGFLRTKVVLPLAIVVVLAGAIAGLFSISILHSHASTSSISASNIAGAFFNNPNDSGTFDVNPSTTPVFTQAFSSLNFNPPTSMQSCTNSTGVDENARPFTEVSSNSDGSCTTTPVQDTSGDQAGVGNLFSFEAEYTANLTVPAAGQMTTSIYADDGWILSIGKDGHGDQPTPAAGNIMTNPPTGNQGPFTGYPEMGDNNTISPPTSSTITENFPAAGTYPIELDYTECCGGQLTLVVNNSFTPSQSGTLISGITLSVTPTTPLYKVDADVQLFSANVACPATLILNVAALTSTVNDVCNGTQNAPSDVHILLPVFDPANSANNLTPNSSPTAQATINDQGGQDQKSVTVSIPPAPIWVGVGDSYSSGHHQLAEHRNCFPEFNPVCQVIPNDPTFSWVTRAVNQFNNQLNVPAVWQMTADVLAISGKTTSQILSDQIPTMETQLTNHHGSWNVVSMDGGANDVDFSGQLLNFYTSNSLNNLHPWNITSAAKCVNTQALYTNLQQQSTAIVNNLNLLVADAVLVDQNVRIVDLEYPYVMNTSNICSKDHMVKQGKKMVFVHGAKTVVDGLDSLHSQITGSNIVHIDLRADFGTSPLNDLQLIEAYGYPHPNDAGQQAIAGFAVTGVISLP